MTTNQLQFTMQFQAQSNWAWSAVASSVSAFYGGNTTQCELANWAFAQNTCCVNGSSSTCNRPYSISDALQYLKTLLALQQNALTPDKIKQEIDAGRPVVVRLRWVSGQSSHCVVITGYDDNGYEPIIFVSDSALGNSVLTFNNFPANYHGGATWVSTCLTKKP
ncbi:MAG: hypothetical protein JWP12_3786 [Bacteroidetes bacterium]|nr:hypothetical protein [Bacteroidota bacterium]